MSDPRVGTVPIKARSHDFAVHSDLHPRCYLTLMAMFPPRGIQPDWEMPTLRSPAHKPGWTIIAGSCALRGVHVGELNARLGPT